MSLEAIKTINEAEETAKRTKKEAVQAANRMVVQSEDDGRRTVAEAVEKANARLAQERRQAAETARDEAKELARTTENRKAAMLVKADLRADQAIALVIERIVRS